MDVKDMGPRLVLIDENSDSEEHIDARLVSVPRSSYRLRCSYQSGFTCVSRRSVKSRQIRNMTDIPTETNRLSMIDMDWSCVSAKDLLLLLNPYLPENGRILSVAVYPSEFRIQRMEGEEIYGPVENDGAYIRRDYQAVAVCDSVATAVCLFKSCDGVEFEVERSSNKIDFGFIPNSIKFKHPPCDIANEHLARGSEVLRSVPDPAGSKECD